MAYLGFDRPCRNGCGRQRSTYGGLCVPCHVARVPTDPVVCLCAEPIVEPIPFFNAVQCGYCKRPFRHLLPYPEDVVSMRCAATIRYARRCSRTASWMVDGEPMCGQHATKHSRDLDDGQCYPLAEWDGSCTGAFRCPAAVHFEGCYQPYPTRATR